MIPFESLGGFLFSFYSKYGRILSHFRDKARYWSKIAIFSYPFVFDAPLRGPHRNIAITFGVGKLEWCMATRSWKKFEDTFSSFDTIRACDRRDRRTDRRFATAQSALCIASRGKNWFHILANHRTVIIHSSPPTSKLHAKSFHSKNEQVSTAPIPTRCGPDRSDLDLWPSGFKTALPLLVTPGVGRVTSPVVFELMVGTG